MDAWLPRPCTYNGAAQGLQPAAKYPGIMEVSFANPETISNGFGTVLGGYYNGRNFSGDIAEVAVYGALTTAQEQSIIGYLGDKYGIGTPYNAAVPEPSTVVLLGMGLLGLLCYAWRKGK